MRVSIFCGRALMFTSRDQKRMNIDDGPQSARQKKSRVPSTRQSSSLWLLVNDESLRLSTQPLFDLLSNLFTTLAIIIILQHQTKAAPSLAVFGRRLKTELFRRRYNAV